MSDPRLRPTPARRRTSSITALKDIPNLASPSTTDPGFIATKPPASNPVKARPAKATDDARLTRWLKDPSSTFLALSSILTIYLASSIFFPNSPNPARPFLLLSHQIPSLPTHYTKGLLDIPFCFFYTIFFFFIRQLSTRHLFPPLARRLGIYKSIKIDRFVEQAYAVLTWGPFTCWGIMVMKSLGLGWYRTSAFFEHYETHHQMPANLKAYYLVQSSFWISQMMVLGLKMEKPRDDLLELALHHVVTAYLIIASYLMNWTLIGNAIFLSMDVSDSVLALAKCFSYTEPPEFLASGAFAIFVLVWSYFRHYLNLKILFNLPSDFNLIKPKYRIWDPSQEVYANTPAKWGVFIPIFLLQLVNLYWYYRIWVILVKTLRGSGVQDDREEGEGEGVEDSKDD